MAYLWPVCSRCIFARVSAPACVRSRLIQKLTLSDAMASVMADSSRNADLANRITLAGFLGSGNSSAGEVLSVSGRIMRNCRRAAAPRVAAELVAEFVDGAPTG